MIIPVLHQVTLGPYIGALNPAFDNSLLRQQLQQLSGHLAKGRVLSAGRDAVVALPLSDRGDIFAVKVYARQRAVKDWSDRFYKSKAERSYAIAWYLQSHQVATPAPVAWLDRWQQGRLVESYYICVYVEAPSFTECLAQILYQIRDNEPLIALLHRLAPAVKALHDAGVQHGDLGNQNILLPADDAAPLFIDLNRARIQPRGLSMQQRARDLDRFALTEPYLKIFLHIYFDHGDIPPVFKRYLKRYRRRYAWHGRSRALRHPVRTLRQKGTAVTSVYPAPENIWLWDEKSAQPTITLSGREKLPIRLRHLSSLIGDSLRSLWVLPKVMKHYRQVLARSYQTPLMLEGRIGVALHPRDDYMDHELELLQELGNPPVFIRFYHHEIPGIWQKTIALIDRLYQQNTRIMVALIQDRHALLYPERWADFLEQIIPVIAHKVAHIEIAHAPNRVKWGIWSTQDYHALLMPALAYKQRFPDLKITGPACIDFEYHRVLSALNAVPRDIPLDGLSHLLYVDRRGAPEDTQAKFSTLEKCALLKSVAEWSDKTAGKVIISEVNWPVQHTGIYSPVGSPYTAPEWFRHNPGESEQDYAHYMLRYLVIALCSGHIDQVFWWRLSAHGYGLVDDKNNFRPRPAFMALVFFLRLLGKAQFIKRWSSDKVYCFEFHTENQRICMAWTDQPKSAPLPQVNYHSLLDCMGEPVDDTVLTRAPVYLLAPLDGVIVN